MKKGKQRKVKERAVRHSRIDAEGAGWREADAALEGSCPHRPSITHGRHPTPLPPGSEGRGVRADRKAQDLEKASDRRAAAGAEKSGKSSKSSGSGKPAISSHIDRDVPFVLSVLGRVLLRPGGIDEHVAVFVLFPDEFFLLLLFGHGGGLAGSLPHSGDGSPVGWGIIRGPLTGFKEFKGCHGREGGRASGGERPETPTFPPEAILSIYL